MDSTHLQIETPPERLRLLLDGRRGETLKLPAAACEALEIAEDPECRPEQLACVISHDPMLAADTLAIANSAAFAQGRTLASLHQAIVRIGIRQCKNLIIASSSAGMMKRLPLEQVWVRDLLLQHSFATASAAGHLNQLLGLRFEGEEFTAGLLHDLGRLIFALVDPKNFEEADLLDFIEPGQLLERERQFFRTDHCHMGAWFAQQQKLPRALVESILLHHNPSAACNHHRLVAITAAADHIANHIQRFNEAVSYEPEGNVAIKVLEELEGRPFTESFDNVAHEVITKTQADLEMSCRHQCSSEPECHS
ncbi:HDOD domain-containing protein [Roseiconus lacunae]|uniref:HDOD domain-containing protein n=1 Tax=Roseiconus lacunae TaxID=2605694 RepID=A0ABT7PKK3_9BACT|nr:HDOD domain-containing protein [Roseiconus lacunae]MCD0461115.1 HDOD domain-containing protein [Roseiconus lacunae]MDM4017019.1 HDOD domain-containing protein [Roseiconus lacunae]